MSSGDSIALQIIMFGVLVLVILAFAGAAETNDALDELVRLNSSSTTAPEDSQ